MSAIQKQNLEKNETSTPVVLSNPVITANGIPLPVPSFDSEIPFRARAERGAFSQWFGTFKVGQVVTLHGEGANSQRWSMRINQYQKKHKDEGVRFGTMVDKASGALLIRREK